MPTILDYYEYAKLATAAYIDLDGKPTDGATIAGQADGQSRIPTALARQMFVVDPNKNPYAWTIPFNGYFGNDPTGFAATLFQRNNDQGQIEKVLAIRGTEPTGELSDRGSQKSLDLINADLAGIGILGLALTQVVEMVNTILLMTTPTDRKTTRLQLHVSTSEPNAANKVQAPDTSGDPVWFYFTTSERNGLDLIQAGEQIRLTGHSLGGHLAALAARLFPGWVKETYTYELLGSAVSEHKIGSGLVPLRSSALRLAVQDTVLNPRAYRHALAGSAGVMMRTIGSSARLGWAQLCGRLGWAPMAT